MESKYVYRFFELHQASIRDRSASARPYIEYLDRHYAEGRFLLSGRKEPRTGGIILMRADSRAQVEAVIAEDPFYRARVAEYDITRFFPTKTAADLAAYRETV